MDDAEEEELWALTMAAQLKHLQVRGLIVSQLQHFCSVQANRPNCCSTLW